MAVDVLNHSTSTVAHTLSSRNDMQIGAVLTHDVVGTLNHSGGHAVPGNCAQDWNAGMLVPMAFHPTQTPISSIQICHSIGANENATAAVAHAIQAGALRTNTKSGPDGVGVQADHAYTLEARAEVQCVQSAMQVRRLTPRECERLQGFPDGYTLIPWRKKGAEECPDGPRYKALGNSMAVPVMRWIGERINLVETLAPKA